MIDLEVKIVLKFEEDCEPGPCYAGGKDKKNHLHERAHFQRKQP